MKTILSESESLGQLWGHPEAKETQYRWMKYLLRTEVEDGVLIHNNVTRHLILLTSEEAQSLENLPAKPTELMQELIANHFLVPENFDEYRSVNQLRRVLQSRETGDAINHYIILPTTYCNARCFYCYESDYPRVHMTEETAEKLIDFIDEHRQGKDVILDWFGGEPLVGVDRIDQITQGLRNRGVQFVSSMISNGYLFDEEVIERSISLWNLKRIQITLDGPEKVYNQVKAYVGVKENPFQRVLRNIDILSARDIQVNIRLNLDFYNKEDIRTLIEELGQRYSKNKRISVYLNMLFDDRGFEPVHHTRSDRIELFQLIDRFTERVKELKMGYERLKIPSLGFSQCMADNAHAIEVQPDGSFCRCEHETMTDRYGHLDDDHYDLQVPQRWRESIERSDYCPECRVYPSCYLLRRCMNADKPCTEEIRARSYQLHQEQLRSVYQNSLEGKNHETV